MRNNRPFHMRFAHQPSWVRTGVTDETLAALTNERARDRRPVTDVKRTSPSAAARS